MSQNTISVGREATEGNERGRNTAERVCRVAGTRIYSGLL